MNCSVRVRTRKLKKRTKGVSAPINSIIYSCHYCTFESVMPGTSKAYVKTKLSEVPARCKLSEPYQSLDVCVAEKVTEGNKMNSSELLSSSKVLSTEIPGSSSKRTKRKGWRSLKQLAASSADLSIASSRPIFSPRSAEFPLLPHLRRLDSARVMPTASQLDLKCLTPSSALDGEFLSRGTSTKTTLELEPSQGVKSSGKMSDSSGVVATSLWSDAEVIIPISRNMDEFICSENLPANSADSFLELQQSEACGITVNVEDKGLQQKFNIHHSDADAAMLKQFTVLASASKCAVRDTISMSEAQCNLSGAVSQTDLEIVTHTSSIQGSGTFYLSCVESVVDANLPLTIENGIHHFDNKDLDFPKEVMTNKIVTVNSSIVQAVSSKERHRGDDDNWWKVVRKEENCKPEADRLRVGELDVKEIRGMMFVERPGSICKNISNQTLAHERQVKLRTKKKPLFRRVGRQWFTICKSNRRLKWRIV